MRIAHLSDLHLLSLEGAFPFRLLNKRLTGYLNLRFRRHAIHKPHAVHAAAREIRRLGVDHVVITGDVSNLALEREFVLVRDFLQSGLGLPPERVSIVPGNHDAYTKGAHRSQRFSRYFAPYLRSDLVLDAPGKSDDGGATRDGGDSAFPFVHLRGPVAIIGLSTAWPRPPLVASGRLGPVQLRALERALEHPEVRRRTPVVLQHHPFHNPASRAKTLLEGLGDAAAEGRLLRQVRRGLLLHGHLHRRIHRKLHTERGHIDAVGATSASLLHDSDERMAGFNVYEIDDAGTIGGITSHRFVPGQDAFREVPVPER
ncbi:MULTISPECIES: metallophosphoesterase family protein [Sorangium]|uniref:Metallo-Phosphoesterase n=1 Tax=Sorangium cellulosum (strain So ce56) TaxID=448385 RepID=A9GWS0_SORC5|nr:metallophosphoesterase [Sorangium cellulosum]CAN93967.1 putative Metallo-Phosphoesterase [Sorangium cellulosum So ce56]